MQLPDHGANPQRLYRQFGLKPPDRILDFSENIHSFGPPEFVAAEWPDMLRLISRYPDPEGEPFRSAAARFHGTEPDQVIAGNGAAEIFTWLARKYRGKRVVLIEPAFSEYRKTLTAEGALVETIQLKAENGWRLCIDTAGAAAEGCAALYINNPHNPTGHLLRLDELKQIAAVCRQAACELVIDEAFIDFAGEDQSFIPYLSSFPNVIVVRSMTKMYAIAGLRLGYAVCRAETVRSLKVGAAHWNVNALAAAIGAKCFGEEEYRQQVIESAAVQRIGMKQFLERHGCEVTDSAVNFLAFRLPAGRNSDRFFADLLKKGIVLRHTKSFRGMDGEWFRLGMKTGGQMEELQREMAKWLKEE